jgi:hypothetical protein
MLDSHLGFDQNCKLFICAVDAFCSCHSFTQGFDFCGVRLDDVIRSGPLLHLKTLELRCTYVRVDDSYTLLILTCVCMFMGKYGWMFLCFCLYLCVYTDMYVYLYVFISVYMHACMYVHSYAVCQFALVCKCACVHSTAEAACIAVYLR